MDTGEIDIMIISPKSNKPKCQNVNVKKCKKFKCKKIRG